MAWLEEVDPIYRNGAVVLMLSFMVYLGAKMILRRFYKKLLEEDKWYFTKRMVMNSVYGFIVLMVLMTFSGQLQGFYTTLGLAGAGITFALREVIVSFAGWPIASSSPLLCTITRPTSILCGMKFKCPFALGVMWSW
ncbi:MAG TPA: hypothetical protein DEA52_01440 [Clostridiaceae bacterium]|nr:hypothetical protein [Clostridiaceae bacterium]